MSVTTIVLLVIVASLVSGLAGYIVFRLVGVELRRRHLEVGTAIFLQAGVIYAVFLAFIFGQALTSYVEADNAVHLECASLHGASIAMDLLEADEAEFARRCRLMHDEGGRAMLDDLAGQLQRLGTHIADVADALGLTAARIRDAVVAR